MNSQENIKKIYEQAKLDTLAGKDKAVLEKMKDIYLQESKAEPKTAEFSLWRIIMKNPIMKFSAAAVIIFAVILSINPWDVMIPSAYAFSQTVKASHSVSYLHIKHFRKNGGELEQIWLQFDESGQLLNARMELPRTSDGPKVSVLNSGKGHVWFKAKNLLITVSDTDDMVAKQLIETTIASDPKHILEQMQQIEAKGRAKLEVVKPGSKSESIKVIVDYLLKDGTPSGRDVLIVDPTTKLVTKKESYALTDNGYELAGWQEFLNYNEVIDPKIFSIDVPDDVMKIDQTTQEIGLAKGDLTDEQIAAKVAQQFFEALIAEDYASAGKLLEGFPAEMVKQQLGNIKYNRIVSIGKPYPHPNPETRFLCVPCEIEIETDGVREIRKFEPYIRPVYSDPDYWTIGGGI